MIDFNIQMNIIHGREKKNKRREEITTTKKIVIKHLKRLAFSLVVFLFVVIIISKRADFVELTV